MDFRRYNRLEQNRLALRHALAHGDARRHLERHLRAVDGVVLAIEQGDLEIDHRLAERTLPEILDQPFLDGRDEVAWHDAAHDPVDDVFWGPSIHWNTAIGQYVMLLNRAGDDAFTQEGIYVSFSTRLDSPSSWTPPQKLLDGGAWYPQVIGLESGVGTDKVAGATARFFMGGQSDALIEFNSPTTYTGIAVPR